MKVYDFLTKNIEVVRKMVCIGAVPATYLRYYEIYCVYKSANNLKQKMERYNFTADVARTSTLTVQKAVRVMESKVRS